MLNEPFPKSIQDAVLLSITNPAGHTLWIQRAATLRDYTCPSPLELDHPLDQARLVLRPVPCQSSAVLSRQGAKSPVKGARATKTPMSGEYTRDS